MKTAKSMHRSFVDEESVPHLAEHISLRHDKVREQWVLLAPERVLELSGPAVEIVQQCNGTNSVSEIVLKLCSQYDAPREKIQPDVVEMLQSLLDKRFLKI